MASPVSRRAWGISPWQIDFSPPEQPLPSFIECAIVGAGFTGLAAAAWLRLLAPEKSVLVLEAERIGDGASGRTGGMALDGSAADDLPGLGDVLAHLQRILGELNVECDLHLPGAYEIGRSGGREDSPIRWNDSGTLRVVHEVPGGSLDPGKMVSGLARAAHQRSAVICENHRVERIGWGDAVEIHTSRGVVRAQKVLLANNGLSLELSALEKAAFPKLTLAALSEPLTPAQIDSVGLAGRKPFYTIDFPYLWGRLRPDNSIVWGAGLVTPEGTDVETIDIAGAEAARMFASFEGRVRKLHPTLAELRFTHQWGGPILFRENWTPVFGYHPASPNAIVLGAYAGHGVALSVFLGTWAAEALLGRRELPIWGKVPRGEHRARDPIPAARTRAKP
jgi:glycine/D-amino acid oxidase-like deaminating enzyme